MKKNPFHALLLGLYPALMMLAGNVSQVLFSDTVRAFYASLLVTLLAFLLSVIVARDWKKGALIASLFLIVFFSYGHIYSTLQGRSIGPIVLGRTLILLPLSLFILAFGIWWILARLKNVAAATETANIVALLLILYPLYTVSSYYIRAQMIRAAQKPEIPAELSQRFDGKPPSIYYIVLDMHARTDVLQGIYHYDNSWFTDELKDMGFYVADESTSNYSSTLQSISSSLNMEYINYLQETYGSDSNNREPLGLLLAQNKVSQILGQSGYKTGAFQSNDFYTEFRDSDKYVKPSPEEFRRYQNFWSLNSFEGIFLQTTLVRTLYDLGIASTETVMEKTIETPYQLHRLIILHTVEHLPDFAEENEPYFVFTHIVAPHPPYVFGPQGQEIPQDQPFSLSGPPRQNGGEQYRQMYVDQLHFIDGIILDALKEILARSEVPPIIILQGDHGPVSYLGEDEVARSNMKEQHAILNAYYFPDGKYDLLYPSVSPVNSFRIVLNTFFGANYERLPEMNYFIPHARPYDFIDVTERVQTDPLTP